MRLLFPISEDYSGVSLYRSNMSGTSVKCHASNLLLVVEIEHAEQAPSRTLPAWRGCLCKAGGTGCRPVPRPGGGEASRSVPAPCCGWLSAVEPLSLGETPPAAMQGINATGLAISTGRRRCSAALVYPTGRAQGVEQTIAKWHEPGLVALQASGGLWARV